MSDCLWLVSFIHGLRIHILCPKQSTGFLCYFNRSKILLRNIWISLSVFRNSKSTNLSYLWIFSWFIRMNDSNGEYPEATLFIYLRFISLVSNAFAIDLQQLNVFCLMWTRCQAQFQSSFNCQNAKFSTF